MRRVTNGGSAVIHVENNESSSTRCWTVYHAFRPLAVWSKLVGCFPTTNIWSGPYGTREWFTPVAFVSLNVAMITLFAVVTRNPSGQVGTERVVYQILNLFILTTIIQYFMLQVKFKKICIIFETFDQFDHMLKNDVNKPLFFELLGMTGCALTLYVIYNVTISMDMITTDDILMCVYGVFRVYAGCLDRLGSFTAVFLSECARKRFGVVNARIESEVTSLPVTYPLPDETPQKALHALRSMATTSMQQNLEESVSKIADLHGAYHYLCTSVDMISDAFGLILATEYMRCVITFLASASSLMYNERTDEDTHHDQVLRIMDVIMAVSMLVFMSVIPAEVEKQATSILSRLQSIRLLGLDPRLKEQIDRLSMRVSGSPPRISAAGLFSIQRGLITSVSAAIVTYLIVIIQFRVSDLKSENATMHAN